MRGGTVDQRWQHNMCAHVALGVRLRDEQVDRSMRRLGIDGLELGDVEVVVYCIGDIQAMGVVC